MNIKNNSFNTSFGAIKVAQTKNYFKNKTTHIDIYKLTKKDNSFLDNLQNKCVFSSKFLGLPEFDAKRWEKIFKYTIDSAKNVDNQAYIAVSNSKPCGIISFYDIDSKVYLDAICDIPQNNGRRVNYTGSTLFHILFDYANKFKAKAIELFAVTNGPLDVVSKYESKGFKAIDMDGEYLKMSCNKNKIREQLQKSSSNFEYKPIKSSENINLNNLIV